MNGITDPTAGPRVSLKHLKEIVARSFPEDSHARALILHQPDSLPEGEYLFFAKLFSRQAAFELT